MKKATVEIAGEKIEVCSVWTTPSFGSTRGCQRAGIYLSYGDAALARQIKACLKRAGIKYRTSPSGCLFIQATVKSVASALTDRKNWFRQ
jgi:hypothetical protein